MSQNIFFKLHRRKKVIHFFESIFILGGGGGGVKYPRKAFEPG